MTPEEILRIFTRRGPLPIKAIEAARDQRNAMVPLFLEHIAFLQKARISDLSEDDPFVFIYHLLAEWRETSAYRPMARLFQRDPEFLDAILGDAITETTDRVMLGLFDGDLEPLFEIIRNRKADSFLRGEMFDAITLVTLRAPALRPQVKTFLEAFHDASGAETGEEIWWAWAQSMGVLGFDDMVSKVRAVFERGWITPDHTAYADFEHVMQTNRSADSASGFAADYQNRPITDTVAELKGWYCFSPEYLARQSRVQPLALTNPELFAPEPIPAERKPGRNDPCPCGSGKKFKKCCAT